MKQFYLPVFLLLFLSSALAQNGQVSGRLLDAKTQEPLPFGSVFINNTTLGVNTTLEGAFTLKNLPIGIYEFIFSFIGYQTYQTKVEVKEGQSNSPLLIKLVQLESQLSEVEIKESRDKVWEKQLKRFEKVFLGDGPSASGSKIVNPWVIDFTEDNKVLTAKASLPLEVINEQLGYRVFFHLKDFKYSGDRYSIVGNSRYEELIATEGASALQWSKNREKAYAGSVRHLMKSIIDKRIEAEGYRLYADKVKNTARSNNFSFELAHNIFLYDTASIVTTVSPNEYRILFKDKIEVHNINELSRSGFYKDVSNAVSWIEVKGGYARVNKEGVFLNASDVLISGDMTTARIAQQLPLDYVPGKLVSVQSRASLSAQRLQEKVYVMTDKSYYYPGETIWLSSFLNYRIPGMSDTLSRVLYVDLLNNDRQEVKSLTLLIDSTRANGDIKLPKELSPGNYVLRAYTQWMRNYGSTDFYYQSLPVLNLRDRVDAKVAEINTSQQQLKIKTDKDVYRKREQVKLSFKLEDEDGNPLKASLAVTVTDAHQVVSIKNNNDIQRHYIYSPDLPKGMLTKFIYPVERSLSYEGSFVNKKGKPEKTQITLLQDKLENIHQVTTNAQGHFIFENLAFYDSARFGLQISNGTVTWKKRNIPIFSGFPSIELPLIHTDSVQRVLPYKPEEGVILLKEVEVKSKREEVKYENLYGKPDFYLKGDELVRYNPNLGSALQSKIPGYKLVYSEMHWFFLRERGEFTRADGPPAEPVLYVDNVLMMTGLDDTVGDRLYAMNTSMIDHVEVSGMISSNLGANGSNGLIAVYTKRADKDNINALPIIRLKGFDKPNTFPSPDYNLLNDTTSVDQRATIYWNPEFVIEPNKELSFFMSDLPGKYKITAEGVTEKGVPVSVTKFIIVE